ncbi:MAG: DUF1565 domain-containing protein, partial [Crocinitomicaceae bacterium]|nr:DUF1565 domain-containing protein [Crocinitomicaceae bacterium]
MIAASGNSGVYLYTGSMSITNSIIWGNSYKDVSSNAGGVSILNSIVDATGGGYTTGANTIDPQFENVSGLDFRLKSGSPAIGLASSSTLSTDIKGFSRLASPDAGAFENGTSQLSIPKECGLYTRHEIYMNDVMGGDEKWCLTAGDDAAGDGTKEHPYRTFKKALSVAVSGDVIYVDNGQYKNKYDQNNTISQKDLSIIGADKQKTNVSYLASASSPGPVFYVTGSGITFRSMKFSDVVDWGAITINGTKSGDSTYVTFKDVWFYKNSSDKTKSYGGAAISTNVFGGSKYPVSLLVDSCDFSENVASGENSGGAMHITNGTTLYLRNSKVLCNAIGSLTTADAGTLKMVDSRAYIDNCILTQSYAGEKGGLIYATSSVKNDLVIRNTYISDNLANRGAVLYALNNMDVKFYNAIIVNNKIRQTSAGSGAILLIDNASSNLEIYNSTIAGNSDSLGNSKNASISSPYSTAKIYNSIVWGNENKDLEGNIEVSNSIIDLDGGSTYTAITGVSNADPKFEKNIINGSFVSSGMDIRLKSSSPAIDMGLSAGSLSKDITGRSRVGVNDMGAYEYGSSLLALPKNCNPIMCTSSITSPEDTICQSSTLQLSGSGTPAASNPWVSSNTLIATISNTGLVKGLSGGEVTITYKDNNDCLSTFTLYIKSVSPPTSTSLTQEFCKIDKKRVSDLDPNGADI